MSTNTLNVIRSAISLFCNNADLKIGENCHILRLFKAFSRLRPKLPKYNVMWPVSKVLDTLEEWHPPSSLSLKSLTLKTLALVALSCSDRCQTLHKMDIENVHFEESQINFVIYKYLKTTRARKKPQVVKCVRTDVPALDVCLYVSTYMTRTLAFRAKAVKAGLPKPKQLFLSWQTGKPVTKQSLTRWLKMILDISGIDTTKYSAHSYRGAGLSEAHTRGASMTQIMEAGNWKNASTFNTFYNKYSEESPVGRLILNA